MSHQLCCINMYPIPTTLNPMWVHLHWKTHVSNQIKKPSSLSQWFNGNSTIGCGFFSTWIHVQLAFVIFQLNKVVIKVLGDQVLVAIKVSVYRYQPKNSYYILWYGHYDTCSVCFKVSSTWFMLKIGIYACTINSNMRFFFGRIGLGNQILNSIYVWNYNSFNVCGPII